MNFTVYRSSAGSGKTFTLVKEYLRLALSDTSHPPQRYRKILAITFTNKAAAEMKERIISALEELAHPKKGALSPMAKVLGEELLLDPFTLATHSKEILRAILHNYTDFAIGTIDSFTHRIVRAFAHDLHLPVNFEVETDADKLIREAVDILISRIGEDEKLTDILVQFSEAKADDEKTWQIENELRKIANHLLKEDGAQNAAKLRNLSIDDFLKFRNVLRESTKGFERKVSTLAENAAKEIEKQGLALDEFAYGKVGIAGRLLNYAKGEIKNFSEPNANIEKTLASGKWFSGKASATSKSAIEGIQGQLEKIWLELDHLKETEYPAYVFRNLLLQNIYAIAVLNEIEKIIFSFRAEQNVLHISEFNRIISKVVFAEPVPFIYERLGEKYSNYLIDEFQDTSVVQWQNLLPLVENSLAGNHFNMLVGDGKQAIYRWRGGEVDQFAQLPAVTGHVDNPLVKEREQSLVRNYRAKHLAKNFRSKAEIVQFNNLFFRQLSAQLAEASQIIYEQLEQEFNQENTGGYIRVEAVKPEEDDKDEPFISKTISLVIGLKEEDWAFSDIAILTRTNIEGSLISAALLAAGIPVLSSESLLLKQSPVVSFMVSMLRCIDHPADQLSGAQVLEYLVANKKIPGPLSERLNEFTSSGNDLEGVLLKNDIAYHPLHLARLPLYQRCEEIIALMKPGEKTDSYLLFFLDEVLNYSNGRNKDKSDFFSWWEDRSRKASVVVPEGMNAVSVMTIHKSKGLEFPVVILPFANWKTGDLKGEKWIGFSDSLLPQLTTGLFPLTKELLKTPFADVYEEEKSKTLLDVMNVLYVAMTRPEQRLYIFTEAVPDKKKEATSISDLFASALPAMNIPFTEQVYEYGKPGKREASHEIEKRCIRPDAIESHNWEDRVRIRSNSADHWDNENAGNSRDKGKALHEILSHIETRVDIDAALERVIQSGLIDLSERTELQQQLENLLAVPELETSFNGKGKVRRETELLLSNGKRLRPDRVIENSEATIILDYKTGLPNPYHRKQLDRYADALKEMGYGKIEKKLVYMETLKVESW